jgi:BlaI family penicillinase repressor
MKKQLRGELSRREWQIMEALYRHRQATAAEVRAAIPDAPGPSAVRTLMQNLAARGLLTRRRENRHYVYSPVIPRGKAGRTAIRNMLETYFDDSVETALRAVLQGGRRKLSEAECQRLFQILSKTARRGSGS